MDNEREAETISFLLRLYASRCRGCGYLEAQPNTRSSGRGQRRLRLIPRSQAAPLNLAVMPQKKCGFEQYLDLRKERDETMKRVVLLTLLFLLLCGQAIGQSAQPTKI